MSTSDLALFIFAATVALFVTSVFARGPAKNNTAVQVLFKTLGVLIIVLTIVYFRKRLAR